MVNQPPTDPSGVVVLGDREQIAGCGKNAESCVLCLLGLLIVVSERQT